MFVSSQSSQSSFKDHTLVISSPGSYGEAANLGADLSIMNNGFEHVGYFESDHIVPLIGNDILSEKEAQGKVTLANEVYTNADSKLTIFSFRSGVSKGRLQEFVEELEKWFTEGGFKTMVILTSTYNPVRKIRVSNTQIPKLFYYENIHFGKVQELTISRQE